MMRWVVGSILHGVDPLSYFSFQPVLHDWCNKGCGMCYHVCGMVHTKEPLLLIRKSSLCGGSRFPFSLSEWSLSCLTICLMPYNCKLSASLNKTFPSYVIIYNITQLLFYTAYFKVSTVFQRPQVPLPPAVTGQHVAILSGCSRGSILGGCV